jgi:hypothetical protein
MEHEKRPEAPTLPSWEGVLANDGAAPFNGKSAAELNPDGSVAGFHFARLMQGRRKKRPLG